jgi:putative Holliday junction resolvase
VPVHLQDERLSSREAESLLARTEKDWRRRKLMIDAAAAAVILQDFLDAHTSLRTGDARHAGDPGERA